MSCDGYTKTALMGNWYEERIAVPQPYREDLDHRQKREEEDAISFISRNNLLMPLGTIQRAHPWNTSAVIADDGFKEYRTMNKTVYDPTLLNNYKSYQDCRPIVKTVEKSKNYPENQTSIQTNQSKNFNLLSQTNMQRQGVEAKRDVKMNITDFGSTFRKHGPDHERFYMLTTYQQSFDRTENPTAQEVIEKDGKKLTSFAGYNVRPEHLKGIKMTSALTGEVFKSEKDPQQNTRVQRSWLPYVENSIKAAEDNIRKNETANMSSGFKTTDKLANYKQTNSQLLPHDIATSLPLGDGVQSIKSKYMESGAFRKVRTDVTLIRNKPITKR
jgi:hypothetical protein